MPWKPNPKLSPPYLELVRAGEQGEGGVGGWLFIREDCVTGPSGLNARKASHSHKRKASLTPSKHTPRAGGTKISVSSGVGWGRGVWSLPSSVPMITWEGHRL